MRDRVPEGADGEGGEVLAEGGGFGGEAEDAAVSDAVSETFGGEAEAFGLRLGGGACRFDLDAGDAAVGVFENEVDFDAAAVSEVAQGGRGVGPGQFS